MEERISGYYKKLHNMYLKLMIGMVVVTALSTFVVWRYIEPAHHTISTGFHLVLAIYVIANYILTMVSYNGRMNDLRRIHDLSLKLDEYREANDIRWMLWIVVAFLGLVSMFVSGDLSFLIYVALSIILMLKWYPKQDRVRRDLGLRQF